MSTSFAAKLSSRFALLLTGRVTLLILGLVTTAILTRALGPSGFGHYRAAVAYLGLVVVLVDCGLMSVFVREISRAGADQSRVIGNAVALRLLMATIAMIVAVALSFALGFEGTTRLGIIGGSAGFVAYSLHLMLFGLFQQQLRQHGVVLAEVSGGLVMLGVIVALVRLGAEPFWFVTTLGGSYAFTLTLSVLFARKLVPFRPLFEREQWRRLVRAALPLTVASVLTVIYVRADSVLLALLQPPEAVGLYGVPIKIADSVLGISLLLTGLFAPLFAESATSDPQRFSKRLEEGLSAMLIGGTGLALALNAIAVEVVTLLGGIEFAPAAVVLRWLTLFLVVHSLTIMLREAAVSLHVQQRLIRPYALAAGTALLLYVPLIRAYGGVGAAVTLLIADLVVLGLVWSVVRGAAATPVSIGVPARTVLSGLAAALALLAAFGADAAWWARLLLSLAVYATALVVTRALDPAVLRAIARSTLRGRG